MKATQKDFKSFVETYGILNMACAHASKMAGFNGKPNKLDIEDVRELQKLIREAACIAGDIYSTHDGQPNR